MPQDDIETVADGSQENSHEIEMTDDMFSNDGSSGTTGDDGTTYGQDDASQEAEATEGEPDATQSTDNSATAPGGQSYEELRKKLNDQGIEKNSFKARAEELDTKFKEVSSTLETTTQELSAYKEWYDRYYPALNELWKDPELRKRIEGSTQAKPLSEKDVDRMFREKMTEFTTQKDFEGSVDNWLKSHPDVKGQMAKDLYNYLEKHDLMPNPDILDMAYTFINRDRLKEVGAKKQELQQEKLKKASVGGGSGKGSAAPTGDPLDALFAKPSSHYFPGAN